ncbi:MAG: caspase family protein [Gammaproteobacteria bacterium]|nr:caspase family protein [Gammaproteobacteria bacterium]MYD01192.1 caspase family protein [Gammaproteobacteria bacterium]MYI23900.1 caspase family protein [Gammaproteobacteria bacterium]
MGEEVLYKQHYSNSWALLVGINDYQHASPLAHACNDAEGVRDALVNTFHFSEDNITLLLNKDATRKSIMQN